MKLKRYFQKMIYHILRRIIWLINIFNSRYAMKLYNHLLLFVGVKLNGKPRFISTDVRIDSFDYIEMGERVVISERVILLTHDYSYTTSLISLGELPKTDISLNRKIVIGSNVFIGIGSILLPGCQIGDNVIIGAGSVVRGKIPENSVYIGNPGKVIGGIQEYANKCKLQYNSANIYIKHD